MDYAKHVTQKHTSQTEPVFGREMQQNAAGGYGFKDKKWARLHRFLVIGTEGGTFYLAEKPLTVENAQVVLKCIKKNGPRVVQIATEVSVSGEAVKNSPAIFALAMAVKYGDVVTRRAAFEAMPKVCRIPTHLFEWQKYLDELGVGWGRGRRNATAAWYNERDLDKLAYQAVKYRNRHGYTHRDMLRLAHPVAPDRGHDALYGYIAQGNWKTETLAPKALRGYLCAQAKNADIPALVNKYNLVREMLPTEALRDRRVWEALLVKMPITALIRNLGKMTSLGIFDTAWNDNTKLAVGKLTDKDLLQRGRVHPWTVLNALYVYRQGHGQLGSLGWKPEPAIVDALNDAFYLSFSNVQPTGKNIVVGLDQSGSMSWSRVAAGYNMRTRIPIEGMSNLEAVAAVAMITVRADPQSLILGFNRECWKLPISPRQRLDDIMSLVKASGGTDYTQPIRYAIKNNLKDVDAFVLYGDEETWAGSQHLCQAIREYRQFSGKPSKLIVVGICSTETRITDPEDALSLNVVGMSASMPKVIEAFLKE